MPAPLVVGFVTGVTPTKWARIWNDRHRRDVLDLRPLSQRDARAALVAGELDIAFLRFDDGAPMRDDDLHAIPLWEEQPAVVAAKDSLVAAFEELTVADIAAEPTFEGDDAATVELVATGAGIARMPASVARVHSRRDVVSRPLLDAPPTRIALVWRVDRAESRGDDVIDRFIGIVRGRTANSSR